MDAIRAELATLELRARTLEVDIARLTPLPARVGLDGAALRKRLTDWQALLRQTPAIARQLLRKLLPEPLTVEPIPDGVHFRGRAAWAAILAGVLQSSCLVVPPG